MSYEMITVIAILVVTLVLLIGDWIRVDLIAFFVLGALAVTGLVSHENLFLGFSNPAVVTVWAMYILSEGLTRTGSTNQISYLIGSYSGASEVKTILAIMFISGILSAFMNNIGVAALMLPVVLEVCRRTGQSPSRLLIPLAFGCLLGGLVTMIGTPPNLLVSEFMRTQGLEPFKMFDFTPIGLVILVLGSLFVAYIGRHLLPKNSGILDAGLEKQDKLVAQYGLQERTFVMKLTSDSVLIGKPLYETRLNSVAGLVVISLIRKGKTIFQPQANTELQANDRLMVQGRLERFQEMIDWSQLVIERESIILKDLVNEKIQFAEAEISHDSLLINNTLDYHTLYRRFGVNVLAIRRNGLLRRTNLSSVPLNDGDKLLVQGDIESLDNLAKSNEFSNLATIDSVTMQQLYHLDERLFVLRVPPNSGISGKSIESSRIGDAFDFRLLGVFRDNELVLMPTPEFEILDRDLLLVQGTFENLEVLKGIQQLEVEKVSVNPINMLNDEQIALSELILAPRSSLTDQKIADIEFKNKYAVELLAVWRKSKVYRSEFEDIKLQSGDAIVVMGTKEKLRMLHENDDFIALTKLAFEFTNNEKSKTASLIMLAVVVAAVSGWLPIAVAAVIGAGFMVLLNCLTMDEAYRAIDWRAVFLIAGMMPLGVALQESGVTALLAQGIVDNAGLLGEWGMLICLFLLVSFFTLFVPTAALVVMVMPIAYDISQNLNLAPEPFLMVVAISASASLASPVAHSANILVMVPGGYRFVDYLKVGLATTFLVLLITIALMPIVWPLESIS